FDFDLFAQQVLQDSTIEPLEIALIGHTPGEAPTTNELRLFSTESNSGHEPMVEIVYNWTPTNYTQPVELIAPIDAKAVWNLSGHNISGNETPSMTWNSSINPNNELIIQVATDQRFRDIVMSKDSRDGQPVTNGDGSLSIPSDSPLSKGKMYYWRVANYDSYGRLSEWTHSSFLVSSLSSTYLGSGDRHELEIKLGTELQSDVLPGCRDASISSQFPNTNSYGSPYIGPSYSVSQGETVALFQCDLFNYLLPDGYAVESSSVTLNLINSVQTPEVGVWEGLNHQWNEQEVTWINYDSSNLWSQPGVGGLDRGTLLDTQLVTSSGVGLYEWNVTYATQNSMRNAEPLDLIFAVIPSSASSESALFASHFYPQTTNHPTLKIIYIPGSDESPAQPILESPVNGEFVYDDDFLISPNPSPQFEWNHTSSLPISGWALELDVVDSFDTLNLRSFTSWNNEGFDLTNLTFSIPAGQNQLTVGEQYHWRVRALSSTNQLGDWSQTSSFAVPDLNINQLTSERFSVTLKHLEALPSRQMPLFTDTYLIDSPQIIYQANHSSETTMLVGTTNIGSNASSLLRLSLDNELMPINSRLVNAELSLYSTSASSIGESIAIRNVIPAWSNAATIDTFDGVNNWSESSGRGIGTDIGSIVDIQSSTNGWMTWNITELAQSAIQNGQPSISLMLYNVNTVADSMVYFSSTESQSNQPSLELTWANGSVNLPLNYPDNSYPSNDEIVWDETSHALIADKRPVFEWNYPSSNPSPDAWRISIDNDFYDEMAGFETYDSRSMPQNFDIINNQFTPPSDIDFDNKISWRVQPIFSDMLGQYSNKTHYYIPQDIGSELSQNTAQLLVQDGSIVNEINYPQVTRDIFLDEGAPNQVTNSNGLSIGNSSAINTNTSSSTVLIGFNLTSLSLPNTYEIITATLELTTISGSGEVY
ncbi:MAG: DNRLRE domain-containing protein, partial [Candidatus Thermoplasmatota archaeon]|nr:DNRLRE domain-containing protein [Candidatus Thermoplasmatota archaeon]